MLKFRFLLAPLPRARQGHGTLSSICFRCGPEPFHASIHSELLRALPLEIGTQGPNPLANRRPPCAGTWHYACRKLCDHFRSELVHIWVLFLRLPGSLTQLPVCLWLWLVTVASGCGLWLWPVAVALAWGCGLWLRPVPVAAAVACGCGLRLWPPACACGCGGCSLRLSLVGCGCDCSLCLFPFDVASDSGLWLWSLAAALCSAGFRHFPSSGPLRPDSGIPAALREPLPRRHQITDFGHFPGSGPLRPDSGILAALREPLPRRHQSIDFGHFPGSGHLRPHSGVPAGLREPLPRRHQIIDFGHFHGQILGFWLPSASQGSQGIPWDPWAVAVAVACGLWLWPVACPCGVWLWFMAVGGCSAAVPVTVAGPLALAPQVYIMYIPLSTKTKEIQ